MIKSESLKKAMPWLFILGGVYTLVATKLPIVSGLLLVVGITLLIEKIWPEEWGESNKTPAKE